VNTDDAEARLILERGWSTEERIAEAREVRQKMQEMGLRPRSLGEVLFEKGDLTEEQLSEVQREARRSEGREQIAGYRLLEKLGEGAMGAVYKARQLSLDRDVAIKVLAPHYSDDPEYVERFFLEARAVARLNHTNIISGIDVGEAGDVKYLVMEYADGMTVASLLRRGGAIDEERALWITLQMARALDHAHRNGLIHRDVKPDNVIITRDGVAKLCDLGLARIESHPGDEPARMGTAAYISPEAARGDSQVTERSDLYSLGATLFHMLTGRPPFEGADASSVLARHLTEPPPSVRDLDPTLSSETEAIVAALLAKDPGQRIPAAKDLAARLEEAVRLLKAERGASNEGAAAGAVSAARAASGGAPPAGSAPDAPIRRRRRR
jgi:serine/threonine-protein kinase